MKKAGLLLACLLCAFAISAMDHLNELNIILFDTSMSMQGIGDGAGIDIFDKEKEAAIFLVEHVPDNSYLMVMPFNEDIDKNMFKARVAGDVERIQAADYIHYLDAKGMQTSLTRSVQSAVQASDLAVTMERFIPEYANLYIFSDGKGNDALDRDITNLIKAITIDDPLIPPLNTQIIAIGNIFSEEEMEALAQANARVLSFDREHFKKINIYVTSLGSYSLGTVIYQMMKLETNREMIGKQIDLGVVVKEFEDIVIPIILEKAVELNTKELLDRKGFKIGNRESSTTVHEAIRTRFAIIDSLYDTQVVALLDSVDAPSLLACFTALDSLIEDEIKLNLKTLENLANYQAVGLDTLFAKPKKITINRATVVDTIAFNVAEYRTFIDSLYGVDLQKLGLDQLHTSLQFSVDVRETTGHESAIFPGDEIEYLTRVGDDTFVPLQPELGKKKHKTRFTVEVGFRKIVIYLAVLLLGAVVTIMLYLWSRSAHVRTTRDYKYVDVTSYLEDAPETIDLQKTIDDILKKEKALLQNIRVQRHYAHSKLPQVTAIKTAANYVLGELIRNAGDALSSADDSRLVIKIGEDIKSVKVLIQDNGIGVPEDMRTNVFRKKFSIKGREGAGLIKCHKIMKCMNGSLIYKPITRLETDTVTRSHKVIDNGSLFIAEFSRNGK